MAVMFALNINHQVVNIQCEHKDTYAEYYFWSQGLHKQRNQKLNTYVRRKS